MHIHNWLDRVHPYVPFKGHSEGMKETVWELSRRCRCVELLFSKLLVNHQP
jgi:hypothetical protein